MNQRLSHPASARFLVVLAFGLLGAAALPVHAEGSGWFERAFALNSTTGSGKLKSETRVATGFQGVVVSGPMKVVLRQGAREGVEINADDNLLPLIETTVERGTLKIRPRKGSHYSTRNAVTITVDFVNLKDVTVGGSGDVVAQGVKTGALEVVIGGSGSVRFPELQAQTLKLAIGGSGDFETSGRAQKFSIGVGGSGSVRADKLDADEVSVSIGGSGDASVRANKTLDVSVGGSGDVVYSGDAVVRTSIAGSGTVKRR
jgi:hypothetical protein